MKRNLLPLVLAAATLGGPAPAQLVLQINPAATYYRINQDPAADSFAIPLWAFGVAPGQWILIRALGDWDGGGSGDVLTDMVAVFSADDTLLAGSAQVRVPGAIAAGTAFAFPGGTAIGGLPMEIPQDLVVSAFGFNNEVIVQVPPGANDLFVAVPDAFYGDNTDPDQDFGVELWLAPVPTRPGTGEDLEVWIGVGTAAATAWPDVRTVPGGIQLRVEVHDPLGTQTGNGFLLFVDPFPSGAPPAPLLPVVWVRTTAFLAASSTLPAGFATWTIGVPPGLAGWSALVQAGSVWPLARNGSFLTSHAHELILQ